MSYGFYLKHRTNIPYGLASKAKQFPHGSIQFSMSRHKTRGCNPPHHHDFFHFYYLRQGPSMHFFNGADYVLNSGSMVTVPPMVEHFCDSTCFSGSVECINLFFTEEFLKESLPDKKKDALFNMLYLEPVFSNYDKHMPVLCFTGTSKNVLEEIIEKIYGDFIKKDIFMIDHIRVNMIKLLTKIADKYNETTTNEKEEIFTQYRLALQSALNYVDENYMHKIYIKDVCKIALMSPSRFSYIFKQITGKTFIEYLMYLRTLHACNLLISTDKTVYDVGITCGFNSDIYFGRVFKSLTGYQPSDYRKKSTSGQGDGSFVLGLSKLQKPQPFIAQD